MQSDREMLIQAKLNAPLALVWEAWTRPEAIAVWWGPAGFTNTIQVMDLKAGGEWRLTMHAPDGKSFPNRSEFVEVLPLQRIIFRHYNPNYLATINFREDSQATQLEWSMEFETPEMFDTVVKVFKADEGLTQNIEKLQAFLTTKQTL